MDYLSQRAFPEFLQAIPDAIVAVDGEGLIRFVNDHAEQMFGYDKDELLGEYLEVLVPERFRGVHSHHRAIYAHDPIKRPMGGGMTLAARKKDGLEFPCDISLSSVHMDDRVMTLAAIRDITDRKRYEALFVTQLSGNVSELTESVKSLANLFEEEKKRVARAEELARKTRRKDWAVVGSMFALLSLIVAFQVQNASVQADNRDLATNAKRAVCLASNESNGVLRSLFIPLRVFEPTPVPTNATPEEIESIRAQDAKRKAASDAFFNDLDKKTATKQCPPAP